ncbi:hypothetical protein D3C72_1629820 [compost metagenome]
MASSVVCGVKFGSTTCLPPLVNKALTAAKFARWNIGMTCRKTAFAPQRPDISDASAERQMLLWLSITPFGKPVVPPV